MKGHRADKTKTCWNCTHLQTRFKRLNKATRFCGKYGQPNPTERCEDYRSQQRAIAQAIRFYQRSAGG